MISCSCAAQLPTVDASRPCSGCGFANHLFLVSPHWSPAGRPGLRVRVCVCVWVRACVQAADVVHCRAPFRSLLRLHLPPVLFPNFKLGSKTLTLRKAELINKHKCPLWHAHAHINTPLTTRRATQSLCHLRWSLCAADFILSVCNTKRWGCSININCHYLKWDIPERGLPQSPHANVCTTIFDCKLLKKLRAIEEAPYVFSSPREHRYVRSMCKNSLGNEQSGMFDDLQVPVFKPLGMKSGFLCFLYHLLCVTVVYLNQRQYNK